MSTHRSPTDAEMALLSAFLDGELSAKDEADLLDTLAQRPDLQDALDDLADHIAASQAALRTDDGEASLISARVMAELNPTALPADREAAETLASLALDGASTPAHDRRLDALLEDAPLADSVASFIAAADVARAAAAVDGGVDVQRALASLPEHVLARVERTERGWALATAAADGAVNAAEANELVGLCGADDDVYAAFVAEAADVSVHGRHIGDALRAAVETPAFLRDAEKAGAAALQAIAALQQQAQAEQTKATKPTTSTSTSLRAPSLVDRVRQWFGQGAAPLFAASAALVAFVIIGKSEPVTTTHPDPGAFASLQEAFRAAAEPMLLADNRAVPNQNLSVLSDNAADVEAIDGTSTTMVFSTAESNITVIWVAGLDDDTDESGQKDQGT